MSSSDMGDDRGRTSNTFYYYRLDVVLMSCVRRIGAVAFEFYIHGVWWWHGFVPRVRVSVLRYCEN